MTDNTLYYGDNLDILRRYVDDESVDLVYLDPPFNSNQDYNVLFAEQDGSRAAAQIKAFEDTWRWDRLAARTYEEVVESQHHQVSKALQAFRTFLGESDMMAYLTMMAPRLVELRRVLKNTGSIYLHCDPTASHYLKMLMDAVFGPQYFRNEIAWHYTGWNKRLKDHFERRHDILLFYANSPQQQFYSYGVPWKSAEEYVKVRKQKLRYDKTDKAYVLSDAGGGKRVKRYIEDAMAAGRPIDDVWEIDKLTSSSKERMHYPTQKPEVLLERIIVSSTEQGDVVLDPFCGCGTTIAAAQRLGRKWIGIDITNLAVSLIKKRLFDMYNDRTSYEVTGEPVSVPDAEKLAKRDPYQFQWWALGLVGARPVEQKKGADMGIDGRLFFHDEQSGGKTKQIIFSVKAGQTGVAHLRDLEGVIQREKAEIGVLLLMKEPTRPMKKEAASAGFYESESWGKFPKIQILTVEELLGGKSVEYPRTRGSNVTFKRAPRSRKKLADHQDLPFDGD